MKAHKKALELFNKMYKYQLVKRSPISWELAKKQALVCVDEILYEVESYNDLD